MSAIINTMLKQVSLFTSHTLTLSKKKDEITVNFSKQLPAYNLLTIVGKEHTFETSRDLPIASVNEALEAAKHLPDIAPFSGESYFVAEKIGADKTRVYFFTIKKGVFQSVAKQALFILPESLLAYLALQNQASVNKQKSYKFSSCLASSKRIATLKARDFSLTLITENQNTLLLSSYDGFDEGAELEDESQSLDSADYVVLLLKSLAKLPRHVYRQAFSAQIVQNKLSGISFKHVAIASALTLATYLGLSSAYLNWKSSHLEQQIAEQRGVLNELFAKQRKIERLQRAYQDLASNEKFSYINTPLSELIVELAEQGVDVAMISVLNDEITLRMKAKKSTQVMQYFASHVAIKSPTMISPAVKSRGKEMFSVKFKFNELALSSQDNTLKVSTGEA